MDYPKWHTDGIAGLLYPSDAAPLPPAENSNQTGSVSNTNTKALIPADRAWAPRVYCQWEECTYKTPFSRNGDLRRHVELFHVAARYRCVADGCPKEFTRRDKLKDHMARCHLDVRDDENRGDFAEMGTWLTEPLSTETTLSIARSTTEDLSREHEDQGTALHNTISMPARHDYRVGWICALPVEMAAAQAMLDTIHPPLPNSIGDRNSYLLGSIGAHNIVITCLPAGMYGTSAATATATQMRFSYRSIQCCLLVGIGGGAPSFESDIRLGDIVVSEPTMRYGGVIQYDYGKAIDGGRFIPTGTLDKPPEVLLKALARLKAQHMVHGSSIHLLYNEALVIYPLLRETCYYPGEEYDRLFAADYSHRGSASTCDGCNPARLQPRPYRPDPQPRVFYGLIASANKVIRDARTRDQLARDHGILCFEMEAAGLMNTFPCLVIRGICDYSDSHKNKQWQGYAAIMAAAYAKELMLLLPSHELD